MYPEYLFNNDTQAMRNGIARLAKSDEPALHKECQEVSQRVDTSSLDAKGECAKSIHSVTAVFQNLKEVLEGLSRSLAGGGVFGTGNAKADFATVCRAITAMEEERRRLLFCIAECTKVRQALFSAVADANRALHFLRTARSTVPEELRDRYTATVKRAEAAYARLTETDDAVREAQNFSMTFTERHMPAFMERMRSAADFNHAGEALNRGSIRALCAEALIVINRAQNITF